MDESPRNVPATQANPGYAAGQLAKALTTAQEHPDAATRARAQQKIARWTQVLEGMLHGHLTVGSRTPVAGTPGWVTLEVVTGGFATGSKLAGGPLLDHERALLAELPTVPEARAHRLLNAYFLSEAGFARLQERLNSGCYAINVPEEGALLVVAWLVQHGHLDAARTLLEELGPYFHELRFYPVFTDRPCRCGTQVFLQSVGETRQALQALQPNPRILAQREAITVWTPLYDRMIDVFLETVSGELPSLPPAPLGSASPRTGQPVGGWPCQHFPEGWTQRAQSLLAEIDAQRQVHRLCGRPDRRRDPFCQLRDILRRACQSPQALTGQEVGRVRLILAGYLTQRGTPGSEAGHQRRQRQARQIAPPLYYDLAQVLLQRLAAFPIEGGLDSLEPVLAQLSKTEAVRYGLPPGATIPAALERKVQRCLFETVEQLVARGVITSAEVLARVLPQMTSGLKAAALTDQSLREVYAAIYRAFRQRRSLLLLNLESQVRLTELPWIAVLAPFRQATPSTRELARQTLEELAVLTLASFPQTIVPNKLLQELRALAKEAGLDLPLVEELAADIFMGQFGGHFVKAAHRAAELLSESLYATYYGIDYAQVRAIPEPPAAGVARWFRTALPDTLAQWCATRAGVALGNWDPATNGMIIEQQQIVTTQNLAVLWAGLELQNALTGRLDGMARQCFAWICRRQQMKADRWHARLIMLKNTAYAWRQMIFYLSLLQPEQQDEFLAWATGHLGKQKQAFRTRFEVALQGLRLARLGRSPESAEETPAGRRFLGWSKQRHWLLG